MSWEKTTIGNHCTVTSSKRFHLSDRSDSGIPFYCSKEIIQKVNGQVVSECDYIKEEAYEEVRAKYGVPECGDLLITTRGTYGIPYVYKANDKFYFADGNLTWLKDFDNSLLVDFLYYWILSYEGQKKIDAIAKGTAQKAVPIALIKDIELLLPNVEIQHHIVSILSAYDNLIENNQKQIKLLEEAAQRLYKEWFVDLRFPGYENTKIVDGVPEGWTYKILSDIFDYIRGKSYKSTELSDNSGVLMINLKNIRPYGGYNRNAEKRFIGKFKEEQKISAGDIVMGVTDMTQERRLVGHVAIVPNFGETVTFSMDLIKLVPKTVTRGYLYSTMFFGGYSKKISPLANGVNVLHLKPESMMNMEMLVPSQKVMEQFEFMFEPYREKIESLQNQCDIAAEARDRLLPKLMNGELEV